MKQPQVNLKIAFWIFFFVLTAGFAGSHPVMAQIPVGENDLKAEIVWAEHNGKNYQIYQSSYKNGIWSAKNPLTNNDLLNTTPTIDAGDDGVTWVVWSAASNAGSDLYYSVFNGNTWSYPTKIPSPFSSNTSPSIMIDDNNTPWLVWAGFDGQDDDIFFSYWNGTNWETPSRINKNDADPDTVPAIWKSADGSIRVRWSGYDKNGFHNPITVWSETGWSDEIEDTENEYDTIMKKVAGVMPDLPEFVKNPVLAAIYLKANDEKRTFRIHDMTEERQGEAADPLFSMPAQPLAGEDIIIGFGDSITQGTPYVNSHGEGRRVGGYEPHLEAMTQGVGWQTQILNYGVAGETSMEGYYRINGVLGSHRAKYILILEGTNDIVFGISPNSTIQYLNGMIDISRLHNVLPVLATLTPDTNNLEKNIPFDYNPEIIRLAAEKKVPLADQYMAMAPYWSILTSDGVHPNDEGYKAMAYTWLDALPEIMVTTLDATDIVEDTVVFNGRVNPHGYPTISYFEYGPDENFGSQTAVVDVGSGDIDVPISIEVDGLSEDASYLFRLVASNDYITAKGGTVASQTTTPPSSPPSSPSSSPSSSSSGCFIVTAAF